MKKESSNLDRSLVRAIAWNAAARWTSQVFSWVSTIVVARLLTPYDYGLVGMASLYLNLAQYVSQAGISDAIIAMRDLTRRQIAALNTLALVVGVIFVAISWSVAPLVARFFSAPPLTTVLLVSSLIYAFNAIQLVPRALLQKELRFKLLAGIETARTFFQILVTIVLAWLHFGYWSLVMGYVVASIATSLLTLYWKRHEFVTPKLSEMKRELHFSRQVMISRLAWYMYENADFGVAGRVLGEVPLGNYTLAWNISSAPLEKIANLVTGVTPAYFSAVQTDKSELRRYLIRLTETLAFVTVPASAGLALIADYLVPALLGPKWIGVIVPLRLLGVFVATRSLSTFLPNLLTAIGESSFVMWSMIASAILMPVAFLIGSHWGTRGIAAGWLVAYPFIIAPVYYRTFQRTGLTLMEYLRTLWPSVHASLIMAGGVIVMRIVLPKTLPAPSTLALLIVTAFLLYCGALWAFHRKRVTHLMTTVHGMLRRSKAPAPLSTENLDTQL